MYSLTLQVRSGIVNNTMMVVDVNQVCINYNSTLRPQEGKASARILSELPNLLMGRATF